MLFLLWLVHDFAHPPYPYTCAYTYTYANTYIRTCIHNRVFMCCVYIYNIIANNNSNNHDYYCLYYYFMIIIIIHVHTCRTHSHILSDISLLLRRTAQIAARGRNNLAEGCTKRLLPCTCGKSDSQVKSQCDDAPFLSLKISFNNLAAFLPPPGLLRETTAGA